MKRKIIVGAIVFLLLLARSVSAHEAGTTVVAGGEDILFVLSSQTESDSNAVATSLEQYGKTRLTLGTHYLVVNMSPDYLDDINDARILKTMYDQNIAQSDIPIQDDSTPLLISLWNWQQLVGSGVDILGNFHVDTRPQLPLQSQPLLSLRAQPLATSPLSAVPLLHSLPNATTKLFLEFKGRPPENWGFNAVGTTTAYTTDADTTTFSDTELANVVQIFGRVAEDYAPFNIDVTTEDPGYANTGISNYGSDEAVNDNKYVRIVVGGNGSQVPGGTGSGGLSFVGGYSSNAVPNSGYVFSDNLGNGNPAYTADAIAHEAGHTFGLNHQGVHPSTEYNPGTADKAPVMGYPYSATRVLWWNGDCMTNGNSCGTQNDMAILGKNNFGARADDVGGTIGTAATLPLTNGITISGSGIIGTSTDTDYYSFTAGAGLATFTASGTTTGTTLDVALELHNSSDTTIASANTSSLSETLNTTLPSTGTYYLVVKSAGGYGDVGQYKLSGTVPSSAPDTTPPALSSIATSTQTDTTETITWTTDEAADSQINYGLTSSYTASTTLSTTLTTSHSVQLTGLTANTTYHYRVRSTDAAGNLTVSADQTFTTDQTRYTIAATADTGGTITPSGNTSVTSGGSQAYTITPNAFYIIATLTIDGGSVATSTSYTFTNVTTNHTIAATFTPATYILTTSATNGSITKSPNQTEYEYNTTVTLTATANAGYSFTGWTGNASGSTSPTTLVIDAPKSVTALFLPNVAPLVDAGTDQSITLPSTATLTGSTTDDNLPYGTLTTTWAKTSGPGSVTFGNASATSTTVTFSTSGTYVLTLTAVDGAATTTDAVTITVAAAPVVSTGGGSGGGGGGGGGGGIYIPYVSPNWTVSSSTATSTTILTSTPLSDSSEVRYVSLLSRTLSYGMTSSEVNELQHFLAEQGDGIYPGTLFTTYYGVLTKAGVIRFQKAHNLPQTGIVDAKTLILINTLAGPQKIAVTATLTADTSGSLLKAIDVKTGSTHQNVKILQQFLNRNGYTVATTGYGSPGNETTYFGPATTRAVIKFQRAYNIKPVAGYVGPLTRAKINALIAAGK